MSDIVMPGSSEAELQEAKQARARTELGKQLEETGETPFAVFASDSDPQEIEDRAKNVASSKDLEEAELSYILWLLKEGKVYLDRGYNNFADYAERVVKIGRSKANVLVTSWEMFFNLGLSDKLLGGKQRISWSKFRLLRPAYKLNMITVDNIYEWIPFLQESGPEALLGKDIEHRIKKLIGKQDAEAGNKQYVKFPVESDDLTAMYAYQETIQAGLGIPEVGRVHMAALEHLATKIISGNIETVEDSLKNFNLLQLKKIVESIDPSISCVFFSDDPESSMANLGLAPARRIYQAEDRGDADVYVLASTEDEAREVLGTEDVVSFNLILGPGYQRQAVAVDAPQLGTEQSDEQRLKTEIRVITGVLEEKGLMTPDQFKEFSQPYQEQIRAGDLTYVAALEAMVEALTSVAAKVEEAAQ